MPNLDRRKAAQRSTSARKTGSPSYSPRAICGYWSPTPGKRKATERSRSSGAAVTIRSGCVPSSSAAASSPNGSHGASREAWERWVRPLTRNPHLRDADLFDKVSIANQSPPVGAANIAAGKIDAHADFCPWSEIMEFRGTARKIFDGSEAGVGAGGLLDGGHVVSLGHYPC